MNAFIKSIVLCTITVLMCCAENGYKYLHPIGTSTQFMTSPTGSPISTEKITESTTMVYPDLLQCDQNITDNGYYVSYLTKYSHFREETVQVKNRGALEEEIIIDGLYIFNAEDGYKYFLRFLADKGGLNISAYNLPIRRIPPGALKSLVG